MTYMEGQIVWRKVRILNDTQDENTGNIIVLASIHRARQRGEEIKIGQSPDGTCVGIIILQGIRQKN